MITFFEKIKTKINDKLNPELVSLIDNSSLHKKHKFFDYNKFHIKLVINE